MTGQIKSGQMIVIISAETYLLSYNSDYRNDG